MIVTWIKLKDTEVKLKNILEIEIVMMVIQEDLETILTESDLKLMVIDQELLRLEDKPKLKKEKLLILTKRRQKKQRLIKRSKR